MAWQKIRVTLPLFCSCQLFSFRPQSPHIPTLTHISLQSQICVAKHIINCKKQTVKLPPASPCCSGAPENPKRQPGAVFSQLSRALYLRLRPKYGQNRRAHASAAQYVAPLICPLYTGACTLYSGCLFAGGCQALHAAIGHILPSGRFLCTGSAPARRY